MQHGELDGQEKRLQERRRKRAYTEKLRSPNKAIRASKEEGNGNKEIKMHRGRGTGTEKREAKEDDTGGREEEFGKRG